MVLLTCRIGSNFRSGVGKETSDFSSAFDALRALKMRGLEFGPWREPRRGLNGGVNLQARPRMTLPRRSLL
jgi:hypothetical protein